MAFKDDQQSSWLGQLLTNKNSHGKDHKWSVLLSLSSLSVDLIKEFGSRKQLTHANDSLIVQSLIQIFISVPVKYSIESFDRKKTDI